MVVNLNITVMSVMEADDIKQTLDIIYVVIIWWKDERIREGHVNESYILCSYE